MSSIDFEDAALASPGEKPEEAPTESFLRTVLAGHVQKLYEQSRFARDSSGVTARLLANQRRYVGQYDSDMQAQLKTQGGTSIFFKHTTTKCNAAISWMRDVLIPYSDKLWWLEPTEVPELSEQDMGRISDITMQKIAIMKDSGLADPSPDEVMSMGAAIGNDVEDAVKREAKSKAYKMEQTIRDQLNSSKFKTVLNNFLEYLAIYGTSVIKGPVVYYKKEIKWNGSEASVVDAAIPCVEVVSPFNIYPSPESTETNDGGYIIERMFLHRSELQRLRDLPHYSAEEIDALLKSTPQGNVTDQSYDQTKRILEEKRILTGGNDPRIEVYEFWGPIRGSILASAGVEVEDESRDYSYQIVWSANHVIKIMPNPSPLGEAPYYKSCYKDVMGSFWGNGVPDLMPDAQDILNGCIRSLVNNMAIASGPQVIVDVSRLAEGTQLTTLTPWKQWLTKNPSGITTPPISFYQPNSNSAELSKIFDNFVRISDDETGIPAYSYGSDLAAGAGRTASGLSMLMNAASRGLKDTFLNIDAKVIEPLIYNMFVWNMLYNKDPSIKGDCRVKVRGTTDMMYKEMLTQRLAEMIDRVSNPTAMSIIGMDGYAGLLREYARAVNLDVDQYIPSQDQIREKMRIQQQAAAMQQQAAMQMSAQQPPAEQQPADVFGQEVGGENTSGTPSRETTALG